MRPFFYSCSSKSYMYCHIACSSCHSAPRHKKRAPFVHRPKPKRSCSHPRFPFFRRKRQDGDIFSRRQSCLSWRSIWIFACSSLPFCISLYCRPCESAGSSLRLWQSKPCRRRKNSDSYFSSHEDWQNGCPYSRAVWPFGSSAWQMQRARYSFVTCSLVRIRSGVSLPSCSGQSRVPFVSVTTL